MEIIDTERGPRLTLDPTEAQQLYTALYTNRFEGAALAVIRAELEVCADSRAEPAEHRFRWDEDNMVIESHPFPGHNQLE